MTTLEQIYRYPVKGFSGQGLSGATLTQGLPFPADRILALTRPGSEMDPQAPEWAHKSKFVMLMMDEVLATLTTCYDVDSGHLSVLREQQTLLDVSLNDESGRQAFEALIFELLGAPENKRPPRLVATAVEGPQHYMDKPDAVISLINLATVRALGDDLGCYIDPMRFRANLYIDGLAPWEEFNWIGQTLTLGETRLRVDRRNSRCAATNVNPTTAVRDLTLPATLRKRYGHTDLGVYVLVDQGGTIRCGETLSF